MKRFIELIGTVELDYSLSLCLSDYLHIIQKNLIYCYPTVTTTVITIISSILLVQCMDAPLNSHCSHSFPKDQDTPSAACFQTKSQGIPAIV